MESTIARRGLAAALLLASLLGMSATASLAADRTVLTELFTNYS